MIIRLGVQTYSESFTALCSSIQRQASNCTGESGRQPYIIAASTGHINECHRRLSARFNVGMFDLADNLNFNRLRMHRSEEGSIRVNMNEYLSTIRMLEIF